MGRVGAMGLVLAVALGPATARVPRGLPWARPGVVERSTAGPAVVNPELWRSVYTPGDSARGMALSPDGAMAYVAGCGDDGSACFQSDILTAAFQTNSGVVSWAAAYDGPSHLADEGESVAVSPDGSRVFVTGRTDVAAPNYDDYATVAYDGATGAQLWAATFDGEQRSDEACCVAVTPDGAGVIVTGESRTNTSSTDIVTIRYDASTGSALWTSAYDGPLHLSDSPVDVAISPDGGIAYVTGPSGGADRNDWATLALDVSTGGVMWSARFDAPQKPGDTPSALAVSPDGARLFVTGCAGHIDECTNGDFVTIAYDGLTGAREWIARFDGPARSFDVAHSVGVNPDGSLVYVTGESKRANTLNVTTIAYDATTGHRVWIAVLDRAGRDDPCCLAVSSDGRTVVVTGTSTPEYGRQAYETVAYDAHSGGELWVSLFLTTPASNAPSAVLVTPDSATVLVAGSTLGDWGIVAYASRP